MGENNKYVYSEHMTNMMKVFENPHRFVEEAMYESPIKLMETEWSTQMDGNILKAVKNVGIDVDKNELLHALEYDRGQYDKGYLDGVHEVHTIEERIKEFSKTIKEMMDKSIERTKDYSNEGNMEGFFFEGGFYRGLEVAFNTLLCDCCTNENCEFYDSCEGKYWDGVKCSWEEDEDA